MSHAQNFRQTFQCLRPIASAFVVRFESSTHKFSHFDTGAPFDATVSIQHLLLSQHLCNKSAFKRLPVHHAPKKTVYNYILKEAVDKINSAA